ncbi:hypothetical protein L7F22_056826 [Adiantum nelumboides]|nr:hypothetical protein [Adiantum nelumboides]
MKMKFKQSLRMRNVSVESYVSVERMARRCCYSVLMAVVLVALVLAASDAQGRRWLREQAATDEIDGAMREALKATQQPSEGAMHAPAPQQLPAHPEPLSNPSQQEQQVRVGTTSAISNPGQQLLAVVDWRAGRVCARGLQVWKPTNYGRVVNNLPPPAEAVALLQKLGVRSMRIFDSDLEVVAMFSKHELAGAHPGGEFGHSRRGKQLKVGPAVGHDQCKAMFCPCG